MKGRKFSILLKKILNDTGVKNALLADSLGYDISYISKWTGGNCLPAIKNYEEIISGIVSYVVFWTKEKDMLCKFKDYAASTYAELEQTWKTMLVAAYLQDVQYRSSGVNSTAKVDKFMALYPAVELIDDINEIFNDSEELIVVLDVFSLDSEALLRFAGILGGTLIPSLSLGNEKSKIALIIDLDEKHSRKSLYSLIYLLHLICSFSYKEDFELYVDDIASGKIHVLDWKQGIISSAGLLYDNKNCVSFVVKEDKVEAKSLHGIIKQTFTQENRAFRNIDFKAMIYENDYLKIFMSTSVQWLLGHMTEVCLTQEQMIKLRGKVGGADKEFEQMLNMHQSIMRTLDYSKMQLLIYETAIIDFLLSGEIDIYSCVIQLSLEERKKCIENILELCSKTNISVKIILGGFCNEFKHVPNPCFFSSSLGVCLRIENNVNRNNAYLIGHSDLKKYVDSCYWDMWNSRKDIVVEEPRVVCDMLNMYINSCMAMKP